MQLNEITQEVNINREVPGLSPGTCQCLEVGKIKRKKYDKDQPMKKKP